MNTVAPSYLGNCKDYWYCRSTQAFSSVMFGKRSSPSIGSRRKHEGQAFEKGTSFNCFDYFLGRFRRGTKASSSPCDQRSTCPRYLCRFQQLEESNSTPQGKGFSRCHRSKRKLD